MVKSQKNRQVSQASILNEITLRDKIPVVLKRWYVIVFIDRIPYINLLQNKGFWLTPNSHLNVFVCSSCLPS